MHAEPTSTVADDRAFPARGRHVPLAPARRRRTTVAACAAACLALAGSTLPVAARCEQPALISTIATTGYSYLVTPGVVPATDPDGSSSMTPRAYGAFWALGFGDPAVGVGLDNGGFPAVENGTDGWLKLYTGYSASILTSWASDGRIDGCIDSATSTTDCTAILLADDTADGATWFALATAAETSTRDYLFNQPGDAPIVLAPIPAVEIVAYDGLRLSVASPELPDDGFYLDPACALDEPDEVVVGYKVYWYRAPEGAPPPLVRTPGAGPGGEQSWLTAPGGTTPEGRAIALGNNALVEIGCLASDVYLAMTLTFDSGYETPFLSDATFVPAGLVDFDEDGFPLCTDCDDSDPNVYPEAPQLCGDGRNNDCHHPAWPALTGTNEADFDGDGYTECDGDCLYSVPTVYPGAPQICDGLNNDCDDPDWPVPADDEIDHDGDGFIACEDCDDAAPNVYPGAPQSCDGINTDCNSPGWPTPPPEELDGDGDGFIACSDCDDAAPTIYPGAPEICDGINNDCDDPAWPEPPDEDGDNDGDGLSACDGDCNDNDGNTYPGAPQVCDLVNNDCSDPDWPTPPPDAVDADGDLSPVCADCDDTNPAIRPNGEQICDGINNDCLHPSYPGLEGTTEFDDDGDGYSECAGDCADGDPARNPDAEEICDNGRDDDCDGLIDYFDMVDCRDLFAVVDAFTATVVDGGVLVRWTTRQEIDSAGFRVLRANGDRRIEVLTDRPLPSMGDALRGATYEYLDADRQPTEKLRYWLEEIDLRGETTRFGPVTVERIHRDRPPSAPR